MHDIKIINDVQQPMPEILENGPWIHHATLKGSRGQEYIVFRQAATNKLYIERVDNSVTWTLVKIKDESEWAEVAQFCADAGLLQIDSDVKASKSLVELMDNGS
jgi:hypothetical protein